jgi:hypothetical protein
MRPSFSSGSVAFAADHEFETSCAIADERYGLAAIVPGELGADVPDQVAQVLRMRRADFRIRWGNSASTTVDLRIAWGRSARAIVTATSGARAARSR